MTNRHTLFAVPFLCAVLASGSVLAEQGYADMTREEYEAYRARIQSQIEKTDVAADAPADAAAVAATDDSGKAETIGYGQGYRARQERSAGSHRTDSGRSATMNRAASRGRR